MKYVLQSDLFQKVHHIGARSVYKTSCLSSKIDTEISHVFLAVVVGFGMLSLFLSLFGCRPADCLAVNCV